ncbi:hypothetical protein [Candidatus Pyrohabitans sp.]
MLCRVRLLDVSEEDLEVMRSFFFDPVEKEGIRGGEVELNYMGGELCLGENDFGEGCEACRYMPYVVRKYLKGGRYRLPEDKNRGEPTP